MGVAASGLEEPFCRFREWSIDDATAMLERFQQALSGEFFTDWRGVLYLMGGGDTAHACALCDAMRPRHVIMRAEDSVDGVPRVNALSLLAGVVAIALPDLVDVDDGGETTVARKAGLLFDIFDLQRAGTINTTEARENVGFGFPKRRAS
jgi:hypothetical protein